MFNRQRSHAETGAIAPVPEGPWLQLRLFQISAALSLGHAIVQTGSPAAPLKPAPQTENSSHGHSTS